VKTCFEFLLESLPCNKTNAASCWPRWAKTLPTCGGIFDLPGKHARLEELRRQQADPELWNDTEKAARINREAARLQEAIYAFAHLEDDYTAARDMFEILIEEGLDEGNPDFDESARALTKLADEVEHAEMLALLSGRYDDSPALMTVHAGAGGTESHDWVDMLSRMYMFWAERSGHPVRILSELPGDVAGTKSRTFEFSGDLAYGLLRGEHGVHRLVRISPFDSNNRRHTSFASVDVIPRIDESDADIAIDEKDLRIDTYRASGAGGQHVNKTSSAVRITHLPTGIVVSCQNERSQHLNRDVAMRVLKSKLAAIMRDEHKEKLEDLRGAVKDIAWGNQIRSYVLHPYQMVKDLRTNYETGNTQRVLDGDIDQFIYAYLKCEKEKAEAASHSGESV
jgi:peptide chain release factor 2